MAMPTFTMRQLARSRRPFRPPDPALEPEDGAVHLRRAQRRPHHRPHQDRAAARAGAAAGPRGRRQRRPRAVRRHQAAGAGARSPTPPSAAASTTSTTAGSAACSPTGRRSRTRSSACASSTSGSRATPSGLTKKELLDLTRERDKLERVARRHQGDGRPARHAVRDRHQQGGDRGPGGAASSASRSSRSSTATPIPDGIAYPIPGNDDAIRAISLYCDLLSRRRARRHPGRDRGVGRRHRRARRAAGRGSSAGSRWRRRRGGAGRVSRRPRRGSSGAGRKTGPRLHQTGRTNGARHG